MCTNSKGLVAIMGFNSAFSGWVLNLRHLGHDLIWYHSWPIESISKQGCYSFDTKVAHVVMASL